MPDYRDMKYVNYGRSDITRLLDQKGFDNMLVSELLTEVKRIRCALERIETYRMWEEYRRLTGRKQ